MSNNNVDQVTSGKPAVNGAVFRGKTGAALPTDAKTALSADFVNMGYVSDSGVVNSYSIDTSVEKAWGGDTVAVLETGRTDTWKIVFMESLNTEAIKTVWGDSNVSGDISTGLTIKANSVELEDHPYVIDMVLKKGELKRIVIPKGRLSSVGDISYLDNSTTKYEVTLTALPDSNGNSHYEYIVSKGSK